MLTPGGLLQHSGEPQRFVVLVEPFPGAPGEVALDQGHVHSLGEGLPPGGASPWRAEISGVQCGHELITVHARSLGETA